MHSSKKCCVKLFILIAIFFCNREVFCQQVKKTAPYFSDGNSILGLNEHAYNNRPLYCNNSNTFILTGDKPLIRLIHSPFINGSFLLYYLHNNKAKWVGDFSNIESGYQANKMKWILSDSAFKDVEIQMEVVPMKASKGMAIHVRIEGSEVNDQLVWTYGGIEFRKNRNLSWDLDIVAHPELSKWGFDPLTSENNKIEINENNIVVRPTEEILKENGRDISVIGTYPLSSQVTIKDARSFSDSLQSFKYDDGKFGVATGTIIIPQSKTDYYWAFEITPNSVVKGSYASCTQSWNESNLYAHELAKRVIVRTPEKRLNALASISSSVINALWYDSVYVHGAMLWNVPFPGWRLLYGAIMYGWHDRMLKEADYYISSQILTSDKVEAKADTGLLMTSQDKDSRFYGVGRIAKDQKFYNFQSMFFDQLISEWRATADTNLEKKLMKALSLHLQWQKDCFDPDDDGLYESYINCWPSDSQWYNGGGSAEETSYAYKGHVALRDMALHVKDTQAFVFHSKMAERIKIAFINKLWIKSMGHSGSYLEQGGFQRLHVDPWLYSIFLPIDVGLVNKEQAISSLYYTKSRLQNDRMPLGGRQVWASNWVPGIWSVRERYPGDNYHLALAYFLSGMGEDGWDIFKGTFLETAFNGLVPGNLGAGSGTDFADCAHMFTRALVEGLFGYRPDYPNGTVKIAPTFPNNWDSASISIPDYALKFKRENDCVSYKVSLEHPTKVELYFPLLFAHISDVKVNNQSVKWELLPGIGRSIIHIKLNTISKINIAVFGKERSTIVNQKLVIKNVGEALQIDVKNEKIISIWDNEGILKNYKIKDGSLSATINNNAGNHTLILNTLRNGQYPQMKLYHFKITDNYAEIQKAFKIVKKIPINAKWDCLNLTNQFNGDIRTIYQQKYLSPRPNTVSIRIGTDGYSPWTFPYWKNKPPEIHLDSLRFLNKGSDSFITSKQGVPFFWNSKTSNIAFASLWDNWPDEIEIPVNRRGDAVYFLISGSTNPMQCNIANAVIYLNYSDGGKDSILLIPPINYWNLSPINALPSEPGQPTRNDYTSSVDTFCLPEILPQTVQLGKNCRALLLNRRIKKGILLKSVRLQALSQEVVIGIMGITIMNVNLERPG